MIPEFLNSCMFDLTFKNKADEEVSLAPIVANHYKMYTDAEGVYLYVQFTSPTHLLNLQSIHTIKKIALNFTDTENKALCTYNFETLGYTWEFEGSKAEAAPLSWEIIFAIKRETIEPLKHKYDTTKNQNTSA